MAFLPAPFVIKFGFPLWDQIKTQSKKRGPEDKKTHKKPKKPNKEIQNINHKEANKG